MGFALGQKVRLAIAAETVHGTLAGSPAWKVLRTISRNINHKKNTLVSQEIDAVTRQVGYLRHGGERAEGSQQFELSSQSYDDVLEAAFCGTWSAVTTTGSPDLSATVTTNLFTRATGNFLTDGYRPGDIIVTTGFGGTGNNGTFQVKAVTSTTIKTFQNLTNDTSGSGKTLTLKGKRLDIGSTLRTFTMEKAFLDVDVQQTVYGMMPNVVNLTVSPEAIIGGSIDWLGMKADDLSATEATPAAAPTTEPMASFETKLYAGDSSLVSQFATSTGMTFKLDNKGVLTNVIGSKFSPDVFWGVGEVTGQLTVLLSDAAALLGLHSDFFAEDTPAIYCRMDDPAGNFYNLVIPHLKFTASDNDPPREGPVPLVLPFQGILDPTTRVSASIQRSNT